MLMISVELMLTGTILITWHVQRFVAAYLCVCTPDPVNRLLLALTSLYDETMSCVTNS